MGRVWVRDSARSAAATWEVRVDSGTQLIAYKNKLAIDNTVTLPPSGREKGLFDETLILECLLKQHSEMLRV